jgi:hypothetical protein
LEEVAIIKKLPKENNHPLGENLPNLVTVRELRHFINQK